MMVDEVTDAAAVILLGWVLGRSAAVIARHLELYHRLLASCLRS